MMGGMDLFLGRSDTLVLLPSRECNIACDFCSVPPDGAWLDEELCVDLVEQAAAIEGLDVVAITGGEPFLLLEQLAPALAACRRHGLPLKLITNGSWATSVEEARARLGPLVAQGLAQLSLSADPGHQRFIPAGHVELAVRVALDLGLYVHVAGTFTSTEETVRQHLSLPEDERLTTADFVVQPFGRARGRPLSQTAYGFSEPLDDWGCYAADRHDVTVFPTGKVYPCCSPAAESTALVMGDVREQPLAVIVDRIRNDFPLQVLKRRGFGYLYEALRELDPDLHISLPDPASHVSACSLCAALFPDPQLSPRLIATLDRHHLELAVQLLDPGNERPG